MLSPIKYLFSHSVSKDIAAYDKCGVKQVEADPGHLRLAGRNEASGVRELRDKITIGRVRDIQGLVGGKKANLDIEDANAIRKLMRDQVAAEKKWKQDDKGSKTAPRSTQQAVVNTETMKQVAKRPPGLNLKAPTESDKASLQNRLHEAKVAFQSFEPCEEVGLRFADVPFNPDTRVAAGNLHANYIKASNGEPVCIASQYPLLSQVETHLNMLMDQKIQVLMPLVSDQEIADGSKKMPEYFRGEFQFGDVHVKSQELQQNLKQLTHGTTILPVRVYEMTLSRADKHHTLHVLHVDGWPDRGALAPELLAQLVTLKEVVDANGSLVVHCRAGVGRTGCVAVARRLQLDPSETLLKAIIDTRAQRGPLMVQTPEQELSLAALAVNMGRPIGA